jgi:DNA-binding transcriptional ArsR family regulator
MSMAAISKHLKVLERADLIHKRKEGSFYLVKLNSKNLRSAEQWISYYQRFWDQKLDALAKQLEG